MLACGNSVISPYVAMRILLLFAFLLLAPAAMAQRKKLEQAATYEQAGMLQEAYDRYAHLYQKKSRNVVAHVGMKRTAQGLFDRIQQDASGHYLLHELAAGERKRQESVNFKRGMDSKGLDLQWDLLFAARRQEAQRHEAKRLFRQAEEAFRSDRFAEAEELTSASLKLDADRKEAEYLLKLAQLEPLYRQGKRAMELQLWRDAFRAFKRVTDRDAGYKDAWVLQEEVKGKAQVIIAYVPLFNQGVYANNVVLSGPGQLESQLAATVKQYILDLNEPLILLVERDNTDELLAEQQRQMSGVYDDRYVVEAGKLIGARYVLTAKILR